MNCTQKVGRPFQLKRCGFLQFSYCPNIHRTSNTGLTPLSPSAQPAARFKASRTHLRQRIAACRQGGTAAPLQNPQTNPIQTKRKNPFATDKPDKAERQNRLRPSFGLVANTGGLLQQAETFTKPNP
ncbi:hypothetical protein [Neisseria iguanae]|uniref:Uncharacterized protein n=1 Tax=Neisseria iguanae TaxID=90242 RepID=A0A2P7TX25_9NEIS|nr:hypothetical protein [Neisseria iguanae]PSJ79289.1 hypothetical protein C7N83_13155 [Neisseria iguanae]